MKHRSTVLAATLAVLLVTGACARSTSAPDVTELIPTIPPSDPEVEIEPPAESSTSAAPPRSTEGGSGQDSTDTPGTTKPKRTTTTTTTEAPTTTVRARKLYELLPAPELPDDRTPPFPKSGPLPDGTYWVVLRAFGDPADDGSPTADVTVYQAFFGDACVAKAESLGDECTNDLYVPSSPSRRFTAIPFKNDVTITVAGSATQKHYYVTTTELATLLAEGSSSRSPRGYEYTEFAYLMRIRSGEIARFRQVWTP